MAERLAASGPAISSGTGARLTTEDERAGIGARLFAYVVDSALLFGFCMVFATIGFMIIFMGTDGGRTTITAGQERGLLLSFMATLPAWYLFNVSLLAKRGHTVGQYIMGLRVRPDAMGQVTPGRAAAYWLALHPLLLHPLLVIPWLLFAGMGVVAGSQFLFVVGMAIVFLSIVTPIANLAFMLVDRDRRGIHDRLAGVRVVRL